MKRTALLGSFFVLLLPAGAQQCQIRVPVLLRPVDGLAASAASKAIVIKQPRGAVAVGLQLAPPRHVLLLLDASGSMHGKPWSQALVDSQAFMHALPPSVEVGVAVMNDSARLIQPYGAAGGVDAAAIFQPLNALAPHGGTALFDAVMEAIAPSTPLKSGDSIVAMSDGNDDSSRFTADQTRNALLRAGVRLVLYNHSRAESPQTASLARATGGDFVIAKSGKDATDLGLLIGHQFALTITLPASQRQDLSLAPASGLKLLQIWYPRAKVSCSPAVHP